MEWFVIKHAELKFGYIGLKFGAMCFLFAAIGAILVKVGYNKIGVIVIGVGIAGGFIAAVIHLVEMWKHIAKNK